jgi:signal peptidase I
MGGAEDQASRTPDRNWSTKTILTFVAVAVGGTPVFLGGVYVFLWVWNALFSYQSFSMASASMAPTVLAGDYIFVNTNAYGDGELRFSFDQIPFPDRTPFSLPERGDIAVFKLPRDNSIDYIKRIVGMPGDEIQMIDGVLHINGSPVQRERTEDFVTRGYDGNSRHIAQYTETLPNGISHQVLDTNPMGRFDYTQFYVVPDGHYFVLGENLDNSLDSRMPKRVGFIPAENMVGRVTVIFFSINDTAEIWEVWKWPGAVRFDRLFRIVE